MRPVGYWTKERLIEVAKKFSTLEEFRKSEQSAYVTASRLGLIDEACTHMPRRRRWTREMAAEIASKCTTTLELKRMDMGAYQIIHARGWKDLLPPPPTRTRAPRKPTKQIMPAGYWTKDRIAETAKDFATRSAFQRACGAAYVIATRRGWIDDVCSHMVPAGNRVRRHVYRISCAHSRDVYIGLTKDPAKRYALHRSDPSAALVPLLNRAHQFSVLTNAPIGADEAARMEGRLVAIYRMLGWNVLNRAKAGGLGGGLDAKWTRDELMNEASKHLTRLDMRRHAAGAYAIASRLGLIDEIFASHPNRGLSPDRRRNGHWTLETMKAELRADDTRKTFRARNPGAYLAAHRTGVLDQLFANAPNLGHPAGRKPWGSRRPATDAVCAPTNGRPTRE